MNVLCAAWSLVEPTLKRRMKVSFVLHTHRTFAARVFDFANASGRELYRFIGTFNPTPFPFEVQQDSVQLSELHPKFFTEPINWDKVHVGRTTEVINPLKDQPLFFHHLHLDQLLRLINSL